LPVLQLRRFGQRREGMTGKTNQWMSTDPARQYRDFRQFDADLGAALPTVPFSTPLVELIALRF
jgi:hypothetical protein